MSDDAVSSKLAALRRLVEIVARLREPGGCPWDREQTMQTLAPYLLEEAHEVVESIEAGVLEKVSEELGDLLMNVFMLSRMAEEEGRFSLAEVATGIADKLVRRHPHVFGKGEGIDVAQVLVNWEAIKQEERRAKGAGEDRSALAGVPASLPALLRASRLGEKAARAGFDWPRVDGPIDKLDEEWRELREAIVSGRRERVEEELGDALFVITALGRRLGVNAEMALRKSIGKFEARFRFVEQDLGKPLCDATLAELEASWERAKAAGL
jgi:tetrapyrrole methylase family protein/MazG family protein